MSNGLSGSSGEPPHKKLRVSGNFLDSVSPALSALCRHRLDTVVGAEIRNLSAEDTDAWAAYNRFRSEVVDRLATAEVLADLQQHGGALSPVCGTQLAIRARGYLGMLRRYQQPVESPVSTPLLPHRGGAAIPAPTPKPPPFPRLTTESPVPLPSYIQQYTNGPPGLASPPANSAQRTATPNGTSAARVESPVPVPSFPCSTAKPAAAQPRDGLRFSNSPIPIPSFSAKSTPLASAPRAPVTLERQPWTPLNGPVPPAEPRPRSPTQTVSSRRRSGLAPTTPLRKKSQLNATSPANFRARAHVLASREAGPDNVPKSSRPNWTSLTLRPYKSAQWRQEISSGTRRFVRMEPNDLQVPQVFHVDFSGRELQELLRLVRSRMGLARTSVTRNARRELMDLLKDYRNQFTEAIKRLPQNPIRGRCIDDIRGFVFDLDTDLKRRRVKATKEPMILSLERDNYDRQGAMARSSRVSSLLLAREVSGQRGYGSMRSLQNFTNEFKKCREDGLELRTEWANCAGDIATITWVSNDGFICGTTEHSDPHNQQYNKPGNLVLGSCSQGTLRAFADHRIERPVVEKGENSTAAMRRSQDPWLYTSVVSSDYDGAHDRAYTCGFDRTVKVWKVDKSGATMSLLGTWPHDGNVNFVVASKHASGVVATAADVAADAVRIYHVDFLDVSGSPFRSHSCSRVVDLEGNTVSTDKWAYFPATIQWGRSEAVQHLVAVGYSPRSRTQDDNDIPEDRRGTGEICVWDGLTGERWNIVSGSKLNVFEILWHPTQPSFIAATSPQGLQGSELDARIRSQVRVFTLSPNPEHGGKAFQVHQTLDCTAVDINELTIMPNSWTYCYVTAGCTDGKTYVWDTALGDKPIHVLEHGVPIEEFNGDRESEDTGVKFCAWGNTPDRFYTGSSDGVVKVWNVRTKGKPLVRDLLEVPGPVSFGQFSPDRSKLIIGDATGRVFFLSVDEDEQKPPLPGPDGKPRRRPRLLLPHPEPEPPPSRTEQDNLESESSRELARAYLRKEQLRLTGNPVIGAVQGPNYSETGLFCRAAHMDDDPAMPLVADDARQQQEEIPTVGFNRKRDIMRRVTRNPRLEERHLENLAKDLDFTQLSEELKEELRRDGAVEVMSYEFDYEDDQDDDWELEEERDDK